jgi:hypothetical protein
MECDQQLGPLRSKVGAELRIVEIEQAPGEPSRLPVDDAENLHLLPLGEFDEAHERHHDIGIGEVTQSVLAINLGQRTTSPLSEEARARAVFDQTPGAVFGRSEVEGEGDRRRAGARDIAAEIQAMLSVEAPLVASTSLLVEDIGEAEAVQNARRRETQHHASVSGLAEPSLETHLMQGGTLNLQYAAAAIAAIRCK